MSIKDEIMEFIYENINQNEFGYELSTEELTELERYDKAFCNEIGEAIGSANMKVIDEGIPGFKTLKIYRTK